MASETKFYLSPVKFTDERFFGRRSPSMERSIRRVMAKYGGADLDSSALLPSYRSMRRRRAQDDDQAIAISTESDHYKIMLDVKDFTEGSVTVKAVGDNELIIEGLMEQKSDAGSTATCKKFESSSRKFEQRIMFGGLKANEVTSSVSADGVLTVIAPRIDVGAAVQAKQTEALTANQQTSVDNRSSTTQVQQSSVKSESTSTAQQVQKSSVDETCSSSTQVNQQSASQLKSTIDGGRGHIIPIEIEGEELCVKQQQQQQQQQRQQQQQEQQQSQLDLINSQSVNSNQLSSVINQSSSQKTSNIIKIQQETDINKSASQNNSETNKSLSQTTSLMKNVPIRMDGFENSIVPITPGGSFFKDSFFDTSRHHFESAVNNLVRRIPSLSSVPDPLNWYTQQRNTSLHDDCRAGIITTEGNAYKIVLDVKNFEDGTVNIRALGDSEILVEGIMEKKTENTSVKRRFRQRFVTPGPVESETVTSALSEDGVLTITAHKRETFPQIVELKSGADTASILSAQSTVDNSVAASTVTSPEVCGPFSPVFSKANEENISSQIQSTAESDKSFSQQSSITNLTQKDTLESQRSSSQISDISQSTNISSTSTLVGEASNNGNNGKLVKINYIDQNQSDIDAKSHIQSSLPDQFQLVGTVKDLSDYNLKETLKQRKCSSNANQSLTRLVSYENPGVFEFPIIRRGPFYQDSFFNTVHDNFQSAVRQVLDRWVEVPSLLFNSSRTMRNRNFDRFNQTFSNYRSILDDDIFDDFACYKSLRHLNVREENQAATVQDTETDFKIVLDVHGFTEKDITIRATAHNELIVEGKVEDNTQGSFRSSSFRKQFILPGPTKLEAVYSALSADDILTITVPKNKALSITHIPLSSE